MSSTWGGGKEKTSKNILFFVDHLVFLVFGREFQANPNAILSRCLVLVMFDTKANMLRWYMLKPVLGSFVQPSNKQL